MTNYRHSTGHLPTCRSKMRWLFALIVTVLSGVCAAGCGGASEAASSTPKTPADAAVRQGAPRTVASSPAPAEPKRDGDNDNDNPDNGYYDKDDAEILSYGQAASPGDRQRVTALVKRYFAVAAAGDGVAGCALTYSLIDESIVEDYGQKAYLPALRGRTCAEVMSKLFQQDHGQLAAGARLRVTGVRVSGDRGYALLGAGARPERSLLVHRESGAWKIEATVDGGLP
jgi:hypothetical protein